MATQGPTLPTPQQPKSSIVADIEAAKTSFVSYLSGLGVSRELSLAITKIEEAALWAKAHVEKLVDVVEDEVEKL